MKQRSIDTILAQAGQYIDTVTGAITPPVHPSTTYARDGNYELLGNYVYGRYQNPTYDQVEQVAAALDNGTAAKLFSSGMAAISAVFETVRSGQHIVAPTIMYHGAQDWLRRISATRAISLTFFDPSEPDSLKGAIRPGETALVWIESPVNPTWDIIDISEAAKAAHEAGAILGVDSTVSTPITTKPLDLGADIVLHSATKYLSGHSDVTGGLLVTRDTGERWEEICSIRQHGGSVMGPFEAWLLLRGMRTLSIRFERASSNAMAIARHFEHHPRIETVLYPGLERHPGHVIARRQMTNGFGGMVSLCITGGAKEAIAVATALELFISATSLGGVESLVEHRATVEGPLSTVPPNLLRLSIGIEDVNDLIADLEQALAAP